VPFGSDQVNEGASTSSPRSSPRAFNIKASAAVQELTTASHQAKGCG